MANSKHKFYNLLVVGPDMYFGHAPTQRLDYALPEPGPDNQYHVDETTAPGYKLGSYINVYNFDAVINKILDCDDWSTSMCPIIRYVWDGAHHTKQHLGEEPFLHIDKPEENNIPRNVYVLVQDKMIKGVDEPLSPTGDKPHYHYSPTLDVADKFRGWWISDELKAILEKLYGWKFFENVFLEDNFVKIPEEQFTGDQWNGGIEKSFQDIQYHDLRIAINDEYNLSDEVDNRAMGDRIDVLALFSYAVGEESLSSLQSATATLEGNCEGDTGFFANIEWSPVSPSNPDISVHSYTITSIREEGGSPVELAEVLNQGEELFSYEDDLSGMETGIQEYPKYFISWTADEGTKSPDAEITKLPSGFNTYGVPSCDGSEIILEKSFDGECWTERYGELELSWNVSLPPNTYLSSLKVHKNTAFESVDVDIRSFLDENVAYDGSEVTHEYYIEAVVNSLATDEIIETIISNTVSHEVVECVCDDTSDTDCRTKCWIRKETNPEVVVWMENYIENPFEETPNSTFEINYCIEHQCAIGISDFNIRLKLPEGFEITAAEGGVDFQNDFSYGIAKDEWVITPSDDWVVAKPSFGNLCKLTIDRPIGTKRIEFVLEENLTTGADGCTLTLDDKLYDWDLNSQNVDATSKEWQLGPPLSLCTDEIDMGYGDYLIKLNSIDLKTYDVNFCLSRDDFDTFFLFVINADFQTEIEEIDPVIGQAVNAGWDVTFKNLSPGIGVIIGHGTNPISSSGYETLLRVKNNQQLIPIDEDTQPCVCIFPFFVKLGGFWENVKSIANNYGKNKNNVQGQSSGGSYALQTTAGPMYASASPAMASALNVSGNMLIDGLQNIQDNIDPRFSEIVECLKNAYDAYLKKLNNPSTAKEYTVEQITAVGYSIQLFMSVISIFSTISISKSEQINKQLDNIAKLGQAQCDNYISLDVQGTEVGNGEYEVVINYEFPAGEVAGVQFQINIPEEYTIVRNGLQGDAKRNKYLQVLGNNGAYLCVYDYSLGDKPAQNSSLLSTMGQSVPSTLTSFRVLWTGAGEAPDLIDVKNDFGIFAENTSENPVYLEAKIVTNKIRTNPARRWNGDWYNVDQTKEVNVRDYLVACILCSGGEEDLLIPDTVVVLPDGHTVSSKYFGGTSYNLANINYNPTTWLGRDDDSFQEYVLDFFDANGDGVADISDVVTVRNLFLKAGRTSIPRKTANTMTDIVPTEVCSIRQTLDYEFYVPDECSDFCTQPGCLAKIWVSDIIPVKSKEGGVSDILVEVSYAANCDGDDSLSGAQFSLTGLTGDGILSCVNGSQGNPTALKEYDWDYHIISSNGKRTKDTIVAYATSSNGYAKAGTGVLTYLRLSPDSIRGELSVQESLKAITHTTSYPMIQSPAVLEIGASSSHPMESLYATFQDTSEVLAFKRFGVKIRSFEMTTNSILEIPVDTYDTEVPNHNIAVDILSENLYKEAYDADGDGRISLIDVQTAYHLSSPDKFNMNGPEFVPTSCCVCDKPEKPKIATASFLTGDLELKKISGWVKNRKISVDSFGCGGNYEGGVVVAWTPADGARYYTVYRKPAGSSQEPVPVIGSKVGVIANRDKFKTSINNTVQSKIAQTPEQIDSTVWIDFPPPVIDVCCDWCEEGEDNCEETAIEQTYEYYVVATNECGDTSSGISTVSTPCCNFAPRAESDFILVEGSKNNEVAKTFTGKFDVKTKDGEGNIFTYTNISSRKDFTEQNGKFVVGSGAPFSSNNEFGNANSLWYKYSPPSSYYGPDRIKYFAVLESNRTKNWKGWCSDDGYVNIFVFPPNPKTWGKSGDCFDDETRGTATIRWESMSGITYYKIYRDGEEIAIAQPDETSYTDTSIAEVSQECDEDTVYNYAVLPVFVYKNQEFSPNIEYFKITVECCPPVENPDIIINTEEDICDESGNRQDGSVVVLWKDLGNYDNYKIYRRGAYDPEGSTPDDWDLIGSLSGNPDPDGFMRFKDTVKGCVGCHQIQYDYSVVTVTISGEGELGDNVQSVTFDCCQSNPVAKDQTFVINDGLPISKQLLAYDNDSNIVSYVLLTHPDASSGVITSFEDTGLFSFTPASLFYGEATFTWSVLDSCGNSDTATVTLIIKGQDYCKEDDYIICNAAISFLTEQQDAEGARIKEDNIPQVPFSLNNKSAPSLRRRCGSYSITQGINPSVFATPPEGCLYVKITDSNMPITVPEVSLTSEEDISFNSCIGTVSSESIPSTVLICTTPLSFSECNTGGTSESVSDVVLDETSEE